MGAGVTRSEPPLVLVVDDYGDAREILMACLKREGYRTVEAANGHQALQKAEDSQPSIILMDLAMPEMNGYEAIRRLKADPKLRFAGQITGCEGYVESAAIGLLAGRFAAAERGAENPRLPPPTTALGALLSHITGGHMETIDAGPRSYQPMNINFGLFPPLEEEPRKATGGKMRGPSRLLAKKEAITRRAKADLEAWLAGESRADAAA